MGFSPAYSIPNQPGSLPTSSRLNPYFLCPGSAPPPILCLLSPQHLPVSLQPSWPSPVLPRPPPPGFRSQQRQALCLDHDGLEGARDLDRHFELRK